MKFIVTLLALTLAVSAFACGGGSKDKDDEKRVETINLPLQ